MLIVCSSPTLRRLASRSPNVGARIPSVLSPDHDAEAWEVARSLPPLNAVMFMAVNDEIQSLLERYDALSMSNGLEIRMPFLDWRLVSYALSLPPESILGHGFTKRISGTRSCYLPAIVRTRKQKLQFQGPIRSLLQDQLSPWIDAYPSVRSSAAGVLTTGTYSDVREFGFRLVDAWREQTYPRMVDERIAGIRARYRSDPTLFRRHIQTLPDGDGDR